jgi:hypothetical protein
MVLNVDLEAARELSLPHRLIRNVGGRARESCFQTHAHIQKSPCRRGRGRMLVQKPLKQHQWLIGS